MLPVLSERLQTAASFVPEQSVLADVGTDHGYVPVWLCGQGRIRRAIATDINPGPLMRAREHIHQYGMEAYIETRLSDGVAAITPGEVDAVLIAGMGGGLILHILESGEAVCRQAKALVLQPQSEIRRVREYLWHAGYVTDAEEIVWEDGKFYPMMRVHSEPEDARRQRSGEGVPDEPGLCYGEQLLARRHPVLLRYLEWERQIQTEILKKLTAQRQTEQIRERIREVQNVLNRNETALHACGQK